MIGTCLGLKRVGAILGSSFAGLFLTSVSQDIKTNSIRLRHTVLHYEREDSQIFRCNFEFFYHMSGRDVLATLIKMENVVFI